MTLDRIVVGVDGSADARRALDWAATLARTTGARVVAVHALGLLAHLDGQVVPTAAHRDEIVRAFTDDWCAPLDGIPGERIARDGTPADVLLAVAGEESADLVVVGTRGDGTGGADGESVLGSTSHRIVTEAGRPVLVVPSGA